MIQRHWHSAVHVAQAFRSNWHSMDELEVIRTHRPISVYIFAHGCAQIKQFGLQVSVVRENAQLSVTFGISKRTLCIYLKPIDVSCMRNVHNFSRYIYKSIFSKFVHIGGVTIHAVLNSNIEAFCVLLVLVFYRFNRPQSLSARITGRLYYCEQYKWKWRQCRHWSHS